jgi:uncharacterized integral membrane protein
VNAQPKRLRVVVRGVGVVWGFVLALPLAAALIVFVAQNTERVTVHWTVWKIGAPLVVIVLVTMLVAVVLAEIIGLAWRHQRRRMLAQRESLRTELAYRTAAVPDQSTGEPVAGEPREDETSATAGSEDDAAAPS